MDSNKKDISQAIKETEKEMINEIIEYLKYGTKPKNNANTYVNVYILLLI